ncbi:MAG: LysM peptidoglycan-binding domain-containing protein [Flavobacteriaceae bacterium]|nr:LysM peptidoglycan-binding domain-containing protein [Flavobacteriaceae bacterium]
MISVLNRLPRLSGSRRVLFFFGLVFGLLTANLQAQDPNEDYRTHFLIHKVRKGDTSFSLTKRYEISAQQLLYYNPELKDGLKRKMKLKIPRYKEIPSPPEPEPQANTHTVKKGETPWRVAYQYGITLEELKAANPEIDAVISIDQVLVIPEATVETNSFDPNYNYYTVKPKEGYYRLEVKFGLSEEELIALNPELSEKGLLAGMILRLPKRNSPTYTTENNLIIEKVNLRDSLFRQTELKVALMAPFRLPTVPIDSIAQTNQILQTRNLQTISLDFYAGARLAMEDLVELGLSIDFTVLDTENSNFRINQLLDAYDFSSYDFVVGPFVPRHFNTFSEKLENRKLPLVSPLTTKPLTMRKNVVHSSTDRKLLRERMYRYIDSLDQSAENPCVVIVADAENLAAQNRLKKQFPLAEIVNPDPEFNFVKPELIDSLTSHLEQNWVFLETKKTNLIISMVSMLNAQQNEDRKTKLMTLDRSSAYDDENIDKSHLGNLSFTYAETYDINPIALTSLYERFESTYGTVPTRDAIRGYELMTDLLLRTAIREELIDGFELGETQYLQNKFLFQEQANGFRNTAVYLLQHKGYETIELTDE